MEISHSVDSCVCFIEPLIMLMLKSSRTYITQLWVESLSIIEYFYVFKQGVSSIFDFFSFTDLFEYLKS